MERTRTERNNPPGGRRLRKEDGNDGEKRRKQAPLIRGESDVHEGSGGADISSGSFFVGRFFIPDLNQYLTLGFGRRIVTNI